MDVTDAPKLSDLMTEPGWVGVFTRYETPGAIPNGTSVVKAESEPGDAHPVGAPGKVLGSMPNIPEVDEAAKHKGLRPPNAYWYFVEWEVRPRHAVAIMDWKIRRADGG
jgi:hypothetical protein